jgi:hypothetical protein
MQRNMISAVLESRGSGRLPPIVRMFLRAPFVGRIVPRLLARFLAVGFRNEHVQTVPGVPEVA